MLINNDEIKNIYVAKQFCDMRKQIDDLALIVTSQFSMNVLDHSLFIFTNASRNRIKMLYYEANGFWLFTRRLENGKFKRYLVETNEFTGFNGRNLSKKNVELVFIDEKQYEKKKTCCMKCFSS